MRILNPLLSAVSTTATGHTTANVWMSKSSTGAVRTTGASPVVTLVASGGLTVIDIVNIGGSLPAWATVN